MNIAVIDSDLIGRKRHNFPNLVCMKLSGYHKSLGDDVVLKTDYDGLSDYDKVYIAKVFTDTPMNTDVLALPNVEYGGTGFFYDHAPNLPDEIEHFMPDYHLYDGYIFGGGKPNKSYTDYSIGYLTRGCFRKCSFCVNKKYDRAFCHSPLNEFLDKSRKKICLLDDNFLSHPGWRGMLEELIATGKRFTFKQGLDERLLTEEKCGLLFSGHYDGVHTFAFDDIADAELIESKLQMIRRHTDKEVRFYVLCGYDRKGKYDREFWLNDIEGVFKRTALLGKYRAYPYIMRYNAYLTSPVRGMYTALAAWAAQPGLFRHHSLAEFCSMRVNTAKHFAQFIKEYPEFDRRWFDWRYK